MQILGCIEGPEVDGVVSYQNEVVSDDMLANCQVLLACLSEIGDMMRLISRFLRFAREFEGQALIVHSDNSIPHATST